MKKQLTLLSIAILSLSLFSACSEEAKPQKIKEERPDISGLWSASQTTTVSSNGLEDIIFYDISKNGTWTAYDFMNDPYDGRVDGKTDNISGDSRDCYLKTDIFYTKQSAAIGSLDVYSFGSVSHQITAVTGLDAKTLTVTSPQKIYKYPLPTDLEGQTTAIQLSKANHLNKENFNICETF